MVGHKTGSRNSFEMKKLEMWVAIEVSIIGVIHAQVSCIYADFKVFRFSGHHIGFV